LKDILDSSAERADSYYLLSQCYYLPELELLQKVAKATTENHLFSEMAGHVPPSDELEALRVEFTRLFIGPFKVLAPPYGSAYLEDNKVMGDSTLDVSNRYENEGLQVVIKDAPDHIAMELEFMYFLGTQEIEAINSENQESLQSCRQKQFSFLQIHLARWLPGFVENVLKHTQTAFYRKLAHLTNTFVQNDMAELQKGNNEMMPMH